MSGTIQCLSFCPYLTQHTILKFHPCSMWQDFHPFKGRIIFHCMALPHVLHSFIYLWTFGLLPPLGSCESCWHERGCTDTSFEILLSSLGYISRDVAGSSGNRVSNFLRNFYTYFLNGCTSPWFFEHFITLSHHKMFQAPSWIFITAVLASAVFLVSWFTLMENAI